MGIDPRVNESAGAGSKASVFGRGMLGCLTLGCSLLGPAACRGSAEQNPAPAPAPSEAPPAPESPDRLPPGALLEGGERVFGLALPRKLVLDAKFIDWARAKGPVLLPELLDYVQARVVAKHVEMLETRIVFPMARVKGGGDRLVRIELLRTNDGAEMLVRDLTPPPPEPGLSEAERWKKAGMTADGQLIDPKNLE